MHHAVGGHRLADRLLPAWVGSEGLVDQRHLAVATLTSALWSLLVSRRVWLFVIGSLGLLSFVWLTISLFIGHCRWRFQRCCARKVCSSVTRFGHWSLAAVAVSVVVRHQCVVVSVSSATSCSTSGTASRCCCCWRWPCRPTDRQSTGFEVVVVDDRICVVVVLSNGNEQAALKALPSLWWHTQRHENDYDDNCWLPYSIHHGDLLATSRSRVSALPIEPRERKRGGA